MPIAQQGPQTIMAPVPGYLCVGLMAIAIFMVPVLLIWYTVRERRRIKSRQPRPIQANEHGK